MGRRQKQTAEYFPHFVSDSRTKFVLESRWGNDGYAFWFKLLELLCRSDGHYYDCTLQPDKLYLTAWTKVPEETADAMLDLLASMDKIDRELWTKKKIIWCQTLVDNLAGLYSKRTTAMPEKPSLDGAEAAAERPEEVEKAEIPCEEKKAAVTTETAPEPKKRSRRKKVEEPEKIKYAEYVSMTAEERAKLVEKYGEANTRKLIEKLDNYKGEKGTTYKSDYRAILNWVVDEVLGKKGDGNDGGREKKDSAGRDTGGFKPSGGFRR